MTRTAHRRARCGVCTSVCEQTSTVMVVGGRRVAAWQCLECGMCHQDDKAGGCTHCHSSMVTHLLVRDPSGAELPATDCVDCEQICLSVPVAKPEERIELVDDAESTVDDVSRELTDEIEAHRMTREKLEAHLVEFADALGLINRFEGQAGYDRADVPEMVRRIKHLGNANDARIEAEAKLAELVREVREHATTAFHYDLVRKYDPKPAGGA